MKNIFLVMVSLFLLFGCVEDENKMNSQVDPKWNQIEMSGHEGTVKAVKERNEVPPSKISLMIKKRLEKNSSGLDWDKY